MTIEYIPAHHTSEKDITRTFDLYFESEVSIHKYITPNRKDSSCSSQICLHMRLFKTDTSGVYWSRFMYTIDNTQINLDIW